MREIMNNDTMPARIHAGYRMVRDSQQGITIRETYWDEEQFTEKLPSYTRTDLVDALIEKIKALPVEHWVQEGPDGEPVLVGYVMQAQGEWVAVNEAVAALEKANE